MAKEGRWKKVVAHKIVVLALIFFILSLFMMDVNHNLIGAYGKDTLVNLFGGEKVQATSMFWLGIVVAFACLLTVSIRSFYIKKSRIGILDGVFCVLGAIGLMITLSGGLLIFWHDNALLIPVFGMEVTRITYYHIGIGLDIIAFIYFSLTN